MTTRRSRGDGSLYWDSARKRWIAEVVIGYNGHGKKIKRKASGRTKTEAKDKLKEIQRDYDDGLTTLAANYTVGDAIEYWLAYGLNGRDPRTVDGYRELAQSHVIPSLGRRKLRELAVEDIEKLLTERTADLSTRTLRIIHSILCRAVQKAQARDKVRRNVVVLAEIPEGRPGRPSKAFTLRQAETVLAAAECAPVRMCAYIVVSLLTGARPEEMRALRWQSVNLTGLPGADPPVLPHVALVRSVRAGGDTKTKLSRRALEVPGRAAAALRALWNMRTCGHAEMAECTCLVFVTRNGNALEAHNVRRDFRKVIDAAGLSGNEWTPREMRHTFVSLMSDAGVSNEQIARLVGHKGGSAVTETIYRKQLRPVIEGGAAVMDRILPKPAGEPGIGP